MSEEQIIELINKIKDDKLKEYIKEYRLLKNPLQLLGILDYLDVKINKEAVNAIIPYFKILTPQSIELGSIILNGNLFNFMLKIHGNKIILEINEIKRITLDKQGNKNEESDNE